jgi:hypothetical protein
MSPRRLALPVLVAAAVLSSSACGGGSSSSTATVTTVPTTASKPVNEAGRSYTPIKPKGQIVHVQEGIPNDKSIVLSTKRVHTGLVSFLIVNESDVDHGFAINGKESPVLGVGETAILTVNFTHPGKYEYISTLGGDPGILVVTK